MFKHLHLDVNQLLRRLCLLFIIMFFFRIGYGYLYPGTARNNDVFNVENFSNSSGSFRKNYASEKVKAEPPPSSGPNQQAQGGATQKYEKVATLQSKTAEFERDEQQVRDQIKAYKAVIQYEQNTGNEGNRSLQLMIGVRPENFDSFYLEVQKIGRILSRQITKTDKTNEFLQLNAKRISLEKTRSSLIELKNRGGQIDDYIGLENRILEIEEALQGLGVQLGDYDEENEFCTIRFSLQEGEEIRISLYQRIKVAFEWTVKYYTILMIGLFFAALSALMIRWFLEKIGFAEKKNS